MSPRHFRTYLELVLRILAFLLGIIFLAAFLRFGGRANEFAVNIWILSQAILMLLCCFSPRTPSRGMLISLLIASGAVVTSFALGVATALGRLARDDYPIPVSTVYIVEITIAAWFIYKHSSRVRPGTP